MAGLSVDEFEQQIFSACSKSPAVRNIAIIHSGLLWFNVRAYLIDESFVDIFYNQKTGKTAFAHIRDGQRIFGADNKKGWHWHPRKDPDSHVPSASEITIEEFMKELESTFK